MTASYTHITPYQFLYYNIAWLLITFSLGYYPKDRGEGFSTKLLKVFKTYLFFGFIYFTSFGLDANLTIPLQYQILVFMAIIAALFLYRIAFFMVRRRYRMMGGNSVRVVVIGKDKSLRKIRQWFENPYLGYRYKGFFDDEFSKNNDYLGRIEQCFLYILENNIDEIYCIASKLSKKELQYLNSFADNNLIKFKIIPDNKDVFAQAMSIERYGALPVVNLRKVPLDTEEARILKRIFDVVFSFLVIIFVLSWFVPLMFILIKLESPGPIYFKQLRHGLKRKPFWCYKFRSMHMNNDADTKMALKNDARITRIGSFMRKTSIDELPQFFNVFLGNMSVVGPRPHMIVHTLDYEKSVDKYLVRHFVKPGITGLAQIKGYRGEILKQEDIKNRLRFDIFYVENWCLSLDVKIIWSTIFNVFKGEEKAY